MDRKKVIEEMKALHAQRSNEIDIYNLQKPKETQIQFEQIKYLGTMEFTVAGREELVEKNVYISIERVNGNLEYRYYDQNMQLLGVQKTISKQEMELLGIENDIILSKKIIEEMSPEEQARIKQELEGKDKQSAKTLRELEEQEEQKSTKKRATAQIQKHQLDRMSGPKTELCQVINGETLGNIIGLTGQYIKVVDADTLKKEFPNLPVPQGLSRCVLEVFNNGTANMIGEDKLKLSKTEGQNPREAQTTIRSDGGVAEEQNIITFDIVKSSGTSVLSIGYDEQFNGKDQQEIKFGQRSRTDPTDIMYTELQIIHEESRQDTEVEQYRKDTTEGVNKADNSNRRATNHEKCEELGVEAVDSDPNNNEPHEEDVLKFARAFNICILDDHGYPTGEYDLKRAEEQLTELMQENSDKSVEEIIEMKEQEEVKTLGPEDNN